MPNDPALEIPTALPEPLPADTLHLVVDMQRLFDSHPDWGSPAPRRVLPKVLELVRRRPEQCVFSRFLPPREPAEAIGRWRHYYERWPGVCLAACGEGYVELLPELQAAAARGATVDKLGYSTLQSPAFTALLEARRPSCLLFSGVETDLCVLSTLLQAVELGYRAVVAGDAVASGRQDAHEATLRLLLTRLSAQVDCATTEAVLAAWPER